MVEIFDDPKSFEPKAFIEFVEKRYRNSCEAAGFEPTFSARIVDIYECWQEDIKRLSENSMHNDSGKPDHFKHAGILAYWLRRLPPICSLIETTPRYRNLIESIQTESGQNFQQLSCEDFGAYLLCEYTDVYLAFDFGLRICERFNYLGETKNFTKNYLRMMCYFLKYKNVSPHGLIMIYQSLFT